ncbi:MAG: hypothetical protein PUG85_03020 [Oscillospiraceae bacterium]|nr:hypothetical protein [Oscillospiraceae bacterium]
MKQLAVSRRRQSTHRYIVEGRAFFLLSRAGNDYTPQTTAVKLAQAASRRRQSTHRYVVKGRAFLLPSRAGNDCTPQANCGHRQRAKRICRTVRN